MPTETVLFRSPSDGPKEKPGFGPRGAAKETAATLIG